MQTQKSWGFILYMGWGIASEHFVNEADHTRYMTVVRTKRLHLWLCGVEKSTTTTYATRLKFSRADIV